MAKYDVIVTGAGHNGLVTACYLAKAGLNVCVVEKLDKVGGGAITRELNAPGFKHDMASTAHTLIQANPIVTHDELGLVEKYGLKYIDFDPQFTINFPDNRTMVFWRDVDKACESIAQFSKKDAEAYKKFYEWAAPGLEMVLGGMFVPPPPFSAMMGLLEGSEYGRELKRALLLSAIDICNDWFESEAVRIAMTRFASELMISPQTKGTGMNLYASVPFIHKFGARIPEGGSGALAEALERCFKANGGTVMVRNPIKTVKVEQGKATGVVLDSGEEVMASKLVASNLNVRQMFLEMISPEHLPVDVPTKVRRLKQSDFMPFHQLLALNEAPKYKAEGAVNSSFYVAHAASYELADYLKTFDGFSYGIIDTTTPITMCATLFDPTRAPEGKHTLYLYHYAPARLQDGGLEGWDKVKQKVADDILETARERTTNLGDENIVGRTIMTPLDFYRYNRAWFEGDFSHFGNIMGQNFGDRPVAGWAPYKTPIDKLYLCGPSAYPGGAIIGGAGRAAAMVILADLDIDFEKVVAGKK